LIAGVARKPKFIGKQADAAICGRWTL